MEPLKIGLKAGTNRLTYGQKSPAVFVLAIAAFVLSAAAFDILVPQVLSLPRVGIYVAGFILGMALFRMTLKTFGAREANPRS